MNIARLTEFDAFDRRSAIVCLVWLAREYLSEAERKEEVGFAPRIEACREAAAALDAVYFLLRREPTRDIVDAERMRIAERILDLADRARMAARAAIENGGVAQRYHTITTRGGHTDWEHQRVPKAISIFKRAAEAGRQETHRLLVELCELYPDVVPTGES